MDMRAIISQMAVLFALLALGYLGCKLKALTAETGRILTKVVFTLGLPATILHSATGGNLRIEGRSTAVFFLLAIAAYAIYLIISYPVGRLLSADKKQRGLYTFMMIFGNIGFMGLPVVTSIFGPGAAFYAAMFNVPFWMTSVFFADSLIAGKKVRFNLKFLLDPLIIASILVIPLTISGISLPFVVTEVIRLTGNITTPASMIVIGVTLAQSPISGVFVNRKLYPIAFVKLIIIPVAVWLLFRGFVSNELTLGVIVILSAMPTGAIAAMFAIEHRSDEATASAGVFLTTLLSGITIPLIVYFLLF